MFADPISSGLGLSSDVIVTLSPLMATIVPERRSPWVSSITSACRLHRARAEIVIMLEVIIPDIEQAVFLRKINDVDEMCIELKVA